MTKIQINLTNQEIFDKVANHLLTQNKQSINYTISNACLYYGPDGLKCAVGCLLPEDQKELIEEYTHFSRFININYNDERFLLLSKLQTIHDDYDPESWHGHLVDLANELELNNSVLY